MNSIKPSPQTWTLRFKNGMTTVLLHVDPLARLSSIKYELLKALQQTHPEGTLNGNTIPNRAGDILFAKPIDINDFSAGWKSLEVDKRLDGDDSGKGKGKAVLNAVAGTKKNTAAKDSPQGVGLRDGGVVAFKFRSEEQRADAEWQQIGENDDEMMIEEDAEEWDVVIPSLEEIYGDVVLPGEDG